MFNSTQQDLFNNVEREFGSKIDLTQPGNSYLFFNLLSKEVDVANQYGIEQLNKMSVFSALDNNLNSIGYLLNYPRPYEEFVISITLSAPASTSINAGLQVGWTNSLGDTLLFITQQVYVSGAGGTVVAEMFYTGINQVLEDIPKDTSFILYPSSGGAGGALLTNATSSVDSLPTTQSNPKYREGIKNIYQSSSFGIDGAIQLSVNSLSVVSSCKVYVGVDSGGVTTINGKFDTYDLSYGQLLVAVRWATPSVPAIAPPFYSAVDLVIAKSILQRFNFLNILYDTLVTGKREIPLTTAAGSTFNVIYYEGIVTNLDIVLNISSSSPRANDDLKQQLEADIASYVDQVPLNGTLYFSEVSRLANKYNLISVSLDVNGSPDILQLPAAADEYYTMGTFNLSYV